MQKIKRKLLSIERTQTQRKAFVDTQVLPWQSPYNPQTYEKNSNDGKI